MSPLIAQSRGSFKTDAWHRLWRRTWGCCAGEQARRTWAWMTRPPSRVPPMSSSRRHVWCESDSDFSSCSKATLFFPGGKRQSCSRKKKVKVNSGFENTPTPWGLGRRHCTSSLQHRSKVGHFLQKPCYISKQLECVVGPVTSSSFLRWLN